MPDRKLLFPLVGNRDQGKLSEQKRARNRGCFLKTHQSGAWTNPSLGIGRSGMRPRALHSTSCTAGSGALPLPCPIFGTFSGAPNLPSSRNLARVYTTIFVTAQHSLEHAIFVSLI